MRRARGERGAVAVFVAVVLIVVGGFLALALNIGHGRMVRGQLQNAADAAALAAAKDLDGTLAPLEAGLPRASAADFAARHVSDRAVTVEIDPEVDVRYGRWDPSGGDPATSFTELAPTAENVRDVNAVLVRNGREARRGNALEVFFAGFLGNPARTEVRAEAIAVNGGPCDDDCPDVPLAFFECGIVDPTTHQLECGKTLRIHFSPDGTDTGGMSSLSLDPGSTSVYRDILGGSCTHGVESGDLVNISNGQQGATTLCGPERNQPTFDRYCRADASGACTERPVVRAPIVDGECPPKFNQTHRVVGIASFQFTRIVCGGASSSYMDIEFVCDQVDDGADAYGCGWFGTSPTQPRLVR